MTVPKSPEIGPAPTPAPTAADAPVAAEPGVARPMRLPTDELASLAADYGLDPTRYRRRGELVVALAERRALIQSLDRPAMLEVVRWGRRPVPADASRERLAQEIARVQRWQFADLSHEALLVLAKLRGLKVRSGETSRELVKKLQKGQGLGARLSRRRRLLVAHLAARIVGEESAAGGAEEQYKFLPSEGKPEGPPTTPTTPTASNPSHLPALPPAMPPDTLRDRIEERGLFGGLADRVRKSADSYVNQKLDEIEARIDRKLDEIDKRLGEWRDKEVANRIRILKITLWASVIVSIISLIYAYLTQQVF